jgi:hypothetical protein
MKKVITHKYSYGFHVISRQKLPVTAVIRYCLPGPGQIFDANTLRGILNANYIYNCLYISGVSVKGIATCAFWTLETGIDVFISILIIGYLCLFSFLSFPSPNSALILHRFMLLSSTEQKSLLNSSHPLPLMYHLKNSNNDSSDTVSAVSHAFETAALARLTALHNRDVSCLLSFSTTNPSSRLYQQQHISPKPFAPPLRCSQHGYNRCTVFYAD